MKKRISQNAPKRADFRRGPPTAEGMVDVVTTMVFASRKQRRDIVRGLKRYAQNGEPGAAEALADARRLAALRSLALRNGEAGAVEALADAQRLAAARNPAIHDHRGCCDERADET